MHFAPALRAVPVLGVESLAKAGSLESSHGMHLALERLDYETLAHGAGGKLLLAEKGSKLAGTWKQRKG